MGGSCIFIWTCYSVCMVIEWVHGFAECSCRYGPSEVNSSGLAIPFDWIGRRYFRGNSLMLTRERFRWHTEPDIRCTIPLLVSDCMLSAVAAISPWLRWRFSLRTLLIATTLVAVVLGLIVWLRPGRLRPIIRR